MKNLFFLVTLSLVSSTSFSQWTQVTSGTLQNLNAVYFTDTNTGYVAGFGQIFKTHDGGLTWTDVPAGTRSLFSLFFPGHDTGYAAGGDLGPNTGVILKTVDGGATWVIVLNGYSARLTSIYFTDINTGYAVSMNGSILKTINAGSTWNDLNSGTSQSLNSIFFTNSDTGYAAGSNGTIIRTINAGGSWEQLSTGTTDALFSVYFTDPNKGYAVGGNNDFGKMLKTTDGGLTWNTLSEGSGTSYQSVYFLNENTGYVVGGGKWYCGCILMTNDGGVTWTQQPAGSLNYMSSVYFTYGGSGYAVGAQGTILKTSNGGYPSGISNTTLGSNSLKIYPSPASSLITIETAENPVIGRLSILNLTGQELFSKKVFEKKTVIDISSLQSGAYFVRLTNNQTVEVGKILKE